MELPVESWYRALKARHSRRQYVSTPIAPEMLERLAEYCRHFRPFEGVRGVLVRQMGEDIFKGLVGAYGKIKGPSAYLAFLGHKEVEGIEELVGYLGEGLILEATAQGLSTCWVAGFFDPWIAAREVKPEAKEKIFAVTPLGYAAGECSREEKIISAFVRSRRRKVLAQISRRRKGKEWPYWALAGLEAARLAPSAANRQPWSFSLDQRGVLLSMNKPGGNNHFSKRLDCGIAMLHFEVAARANGVAGTWELLPSPDVARYLTV